MKESAAVRLGGLIPMSSNNISVPKASRCLSFSKEMELRKTLSLILRNRPRKLSPLS